MHGVHATETTQPFGMDFTGMLQPPHGPEQGVFEIIQGRKFHLNETIIIVHSQ